MYNFTYQTEEDSLSAAIRTITGSSPVMGLHISPKLFASTTVFSLDIKKLTSVVLPYGDIDFSYVFKSIHESLKYVNNALDFSSIAAQIASITREFNSSSKIISNIYSYRYSDLISNLQIGSPGLKQDLEESNSPIYNLGNQIDESSQIPDVENIDKSNFMEKFKLNNIFINFVLTYIVTHVFDSLMSNLIWDKLSELLIHLALMIINLLNCTWLY